MNQHDVKETEFQHLGKWINLMNAQEYLDDAHYTNEIELDWFLITIHIGIVVVAEIMCFMKQFSCSLFS